MKRHVALTLLALTTLGVLNAHVDLPVVDGRRFVQTQGRLHDPLGWAEDQWAALTRQCGSVMNWPTPSPQAHAALQAIREFSPPDSRSARLLQFQDLNGWMLAEVEFETLSPAVVPLTWRNGQASVLGEAIWSGSTQPWRPAPMIRAHLRARAPAMPAPLLDCFRPRGAMFQPG